MPAVLCSHHAAHQLHGSRACHHGSSGMVTLISLNYGLTQGPNCATHPKGRSLKHRVTTVQILPVVTFVNPCSARRGTGKAVSGILPLKSSRVSAMIHMSGDSDCFDNLQKARSAELQTSCLQMLLVRCHVVISHLGGLGDVIANTERGTTSGLSEDFKL